MTGRTPFRTGPSIRIQLPCPGRVVLARVTDTYQLPPVDITAADRQASSSVIQFTAWMLVSSSRICRANSSACFLIARTFTAGR